jgi:hypothetical protein
LYNYISGVGDSFGAFLLHDEEVLEKNNKGENSEVFNVPVGCNGFYWLYAW